MTEKESNLTEEDVRAIEGCYTLPPDMVEATDFMAEEAIKIDKSIKLPENFSLGKWIYKTQNQGAIGSCTAMGTSHGTQILLVKKNGEEPTDRNIITPQWKDLWRKMGHDPEKYDGGDYVEKAVNVALKEGILIEETGELAKFDGYAYGEWDVDDDSIEMMKRYLYNGNPIVWCVRGDKKMRSEMTAGQVLTRPTTTTGGHAIALVGWDKDGMWFINSRYPNDGRNLKSRFHIPYHVMKQLGGLLNFRYWVLYVKEDAKVDPEYLKRKNVMLAVLTVLKKQYDGENQKVKEGIVTLSKALREAYPELNEELPK